MFYWYFTRLESNVYVVIIIIRDLTQLGSLDSFRLFLVSWVAKSLSKVCNRCLAMLNSLSYVADPTLLPS